MILKQFTVCGLFQILYSEEDFSECELDLGLMLNEL